MIPKYEEINWNKWYKLKSFEVYWVPNEWTPFNVFTEIEEALLNNLEISKFDEDRNISWEVYSTYILVEYSDFNVRGKDIFNNSKINIINPIKSEAIDEKRQIAENVWYFNYNWKYYLVLYPYNWLTDETNPDKWLYRWVIIDKEKYFWISEDTKEIVRDMTWKIDDILD